MRNIALRQGEPELHELAEEVENAAAVEDDGLFLEAVGAFLESWSQSRR